MMIDSLDTTTLLLSLPIWPSLSLSLTNKVKTTEKDDLLTTGGHPTIEEIVVVAPTPPGAVDFINITHPRQAPLPMVVMTQDQPVKSVESLAIRLSVAGTSLTTVTKLTMCPLL